MKSDFLLYNKEFKLLLLKLAILLLLPLLFGIIGFNASKGLTIREAFILTLETISFLALEKETGIAFVIQVVLILFGFVAVWLAIEQLLSFFLEGKFARFYKEGRKMEKLRNLNEHIVICGGGKVGQRVAIGLAKEKKKFVIIERDPAVCSKLEAFGYNVIYGDALHEEILVEAGIKKARVLMAVLTEAEKNIVVVLTAKELNPGIKVYARSENLESVKKLKKAGADSIITPELTCADELLQWMKS